MPYVGKNFDPNFVKNDDRDRDTGRDNGRDKRRNNEPDNVLDTGITKTQRNEILSFLSGNITMADTVIQYLFGEIPKDNQFLSGRDARVSLLRRMFKDKPILTDIKHVNSRKTEDVIPWVLLGESGIPNFLHVITNYKINMPLSTNPDNRKSLTIFEPYPKNNNKLFPAITNALHVIIQLYFIVREMRKYGYFVPDMSIGIFKFPSPEVLTYEFGAFSIDLKTQYLIIPEITKEIYRIHTISPLQVWHRVVRKTVEKFLFTGLNHLKTIRDDFTLEETILLLSKEYLRPIYENMVIPKSPAAIPLERIEIGSVYIYNEKGGVGETKSVFVTDTDVYNNLLLGRIISMIPQKPTTISHRMLINSEMLSSMDYIKRFN